MALESNLTPISLKIFCVDSGFWLISCCTQIFDKRIFSSINASSLGRLQAVEKIAKSGVLVILALSLIAARADFLWIGNSPLLNFSARQKRDKQTVWLRRILLLEVSLT